MNHKPRLKFSGARLEACACDWCGEEIAASAGRFQEPVGSGASCNTYHIACWEYLWRNGEKPKTQDEVEDELLDRLWSRIVAKIRAAD